ncbi:MAG: major outer membrane protein [Campylobacteraceae bacterium]|nr:major outer membrane protein [Campylobacteraceae bacterium]
MSLAKLSLVAVMATGIMTTASLAAPLEELIKDVDVTGFTRLRYTHDEEGGKVNNKSEGKWNFKGELNIKTKIDDNFFAVVGIRYNESDTSTTTSTSTGGRTGGNDFDLYRAYFGYNVGGTTITVGRQEVGAFFTDDMYGDGIAVVNTDIEGLVLAAVWFDVFEDDGDIGGLDLNGDGIRGGVVDRVNGKLVTDHNLYGVAALGNYDPVSFQLWYSILEDVGALFVTELATSFDITDEWSVGLMGQYAFADLKNSFKEGTGNAADDSDFYAIKASTSAFGFDFSAGYLNFSTDTDNLSVTSFEDQGKFISPGEELLDYSLYRGENWAWFVAAAYTIPDTGWTFGVDYVSGERTYDLGAGNEDFDMQEVVARVTYKHNKNLTFKTWYSWVEDDGYNRVANRGYENERVRFEAKYSF